MLSQILSLIFNLEDKVGKEYYFMDSQKDLSIVCLIRKKGDSEQYGSCSENGIEFSCTPASADGLKNIYQVTITNTGPEDFNGVIHVEGSGQG